MDYKNKYKNALRWIESIYPTLQHEQQTEAEGVFPELAESEDERIRKELIKETKGSEMRLFETVSNDEFVAWLEKLSEQKLTDNVEPKFKVGDWLRNNSYMMDNWDEDKCWVTFEFTSKDEMIKEFHKAMKGGEE